MGSHEPRTRKSPAAAGAFSAWLRSFLDSRHGEAAAPNVPCGDCNACCRSRLLIHIRPDETAALERISREYVSPAPGLPEGHVLMRYNDRGHCPMFVDGRCSIYEHRPQTCRNFDCRVFAATGLVPAHEGHHRIAERARAWKFEYPEAIDREQQAAVFAAAAEQRSLAESMDPPTQLAQPAIEALRNHHEHHKALFPSE